MSNSTSAGTAPFDLYPYNPSQTAAYAFLGLFGFTSITHFVFMIPYRIFFPLPMVLGCAMEAAGYYFRALSHDDLRKIGPYIFQYLMILSAPPLLAAMIYMSPGRILRSLEAEDCSLISPGWQAKLFVLIDTVCFVTQVAGAIMSGSEDTSEASQGQTIILTGLIVQVLAFAVFIISIMVAHKRLNARADALAESAPELHWRRYLGGLYAVSTLFLIRNAVRIVEHSESAGGTIASSEVYLYAFDAVFMIAVVVIMIILHPGRLIRRATRASKARYLELALK